MSSRKLKRIANEIKELEEGKKILIQSGIYFNYEEDKMDKLYIMFIGPKDTPYENGFYFFVLEYPDNYPMSPPTMIYMTQGYLMNEKNNLVKVRFNPNLYTNGKVCLSMLNTWKGPGWVPTNTVTNILVAIQALVFNEEPLRNEPGFDDSPIKLINTYSEVIKYSNIKFSIKNQLNNNLNKFEIFRPIINDYIKTNIEKYDKYINELCNNENNYMTTPAYGMAVYLDYKLLRISYEELKNKLNFNNEKV